MSWALRGVSNNGSLNLVSATDPCFLGTIESVGEGEEGERGG